MSSHQATDVMERDWSPEMPATEYIQTLCEKIRKDIEETLKRKLVDFKAISYIELRLIGGLYIVKIHDNGEVYVHAKFGVMFIPDGENHPHFKEVQDNKMLDDPIVPF